MLKVAEGNLDDTDLSGTTFVLVNYWPSNLSAGNWKLGVVIDEGASDEQAEAIERILKGEEGGPFADFAALTDEWLGSERASVTFSDGDKPSVTFGDNSYTFEPRPGPEGSGAHATVRNAFFGFAPEFRIGTAPSSVSALGMEFDSVYAESADYEFASEMPEGAPKGRA